MDNETIIKTVQALREDLAQCRIDGSQGDAYWMTLQSADHLLMELREESKAAPDAAPVTAILQYTVPMIRKLGRLEGLIKFLRLENEILSCTPDSIEGGTRDYEKLGRSYHKIYDFLMREEHANNEQIRSPGSASQGG